jgi:hypothetical protein
MGISTFHPWKYITTRKTSNVANKLLRFGAFALKKEWYKAPALFYLINKECNKATIDPSNSVPDSVLIVIGLNVFHKIFSQTLQAINKEIPDPIP